MWALIAHGVQCRLSPLFGCIQFSGSIVVDCQLVSPAHSIRIRGSIEFGSTSEINRVEVCNGNMECVLAITHQFEQGSHHLYSILPWLFQCSMQIGVLTLPGLCYPFIDHYHLVGGYVVQYVIRIERHGRSVAVIQWNRGLSSFTFFFVVLPSISIILNWLTDMRDGMRLPSPSTQSSMVNRNPN